MSCSVALSGNSAFCLSDCITWQKRFSLCHLAFEPNKNACAFWGSHSYYQIKKTSTKVKVFFMGRIVGFEPTHIGTTIRGLNRLTISAMSFTSSSIANQNYKARGATQNESRLLIFYLVNSLEHISNTTSGKN